MVRHDRDARRSTAPAQIDLVRLGKAQPDFKANVLQEGAGSMNAQNAGTGLSRWSDVLKRLNEGP